MLARFSFLSRLLACVLALTVLAPGFAWAVADWGHAPASGCDAKHGAAHGDTSAKMHDKAHDETHCAGADQCAGNHHCCPGHLPAHPVAGLRLPLPDGARFAALEDGAAFSSQIPSGLERPPKHRAV